MRAIHRLSDRKVRKAGEGLHADGGGLYLQVRRGVNGLTRSWLFRFAVGKRERMMGLGAYPAVSLAVARQKAAEARSQRAVGVDPIDAKDAVRTSNAVASAKAMTFDECAAAYLASHRAGWTPGYAEAWEGSLARHVFPVFGKLPPSVIDVTLIMRAFEPIWTAMPVQAPLVRERCESVWSWAKARGYCTGENPFRWDNLKHLLASPAKIHTVRHHPAMPYAELPGFIRELRVVSHVSARALELLILTATRTSEVTGARWSELNSDTWTIPPERMKARVEHRVPLSSPALKIIDGRRQVRCYDFVFPGMKGRGLSRATMDNLLVRMGRDITVHGFRSTFRDWAAETTPFPNHVVEMALAHKVGNAVEAAYRRGDLFEKRKELMAAWAAFCEAPA